MKRLIVLICTVIVLTGCVPFKPTEVFPAVVANNTVVSVPMPTPIYTPPTQPYVPVVEEAKPPTVNPYLKAENYTDASGYFPIYVSNVPRTWWIPRYEAPPIPQATIVFWTGIATVEVID